MAGPYGYLLTRKDTLHFSECGAVGDFNPGTREGTDNSAAWAKFLDRLNATGATGIIGVGRYYIPVAPGVVLDPDQRTVPTLQIGSVSIHCMAGVEFYSGRAATDERPATTVSRPILIAQGSGGRFEITGNPVFDGGISSADDIGGSLGTGAFPGVASLIEVSGFSSVQIDATFRHFAQNWDNRTPENGNGLRRGPLFVWGNGQVTGDVHLHAPTFREGPAFGNNIFTDVRVSFKGNPTLIGTSGNVSSPFNFVSGSDDPDVGGRSVTVRVGDWSGAWTGSAINAYSPGDLTIDLGGGVIAGGNDGVNTSTAANASGGGVFGKGIDVGSEIAKGKSRSVTFKNGTIRDAFQYSILVNRTSDTKLGELSFSNFIVDGGWLGLIARYVDVLSGALTVDGVIQYDPTDARFGVSAYLTDVQRGDFRLVAMGGRTAAYEAPNLAVPIASGTKQSNRGLVAERVGSALRIDLTSHDHRNQHVQYSVTADADNEKSHANIRVTATTDVYASPASGVFFVFGSSGTRKLLTAFVDPTSTFNGQALRRCRSFSWNVTGPAMGVAVADVGAVGTTSLAQGAFLGEYRFFNSDGSSNNPDVAAAVRAYAADNNGRGGYLEFWTGDSTNSFAARMRLGADGSVEFLNLPTTNPGAGKIWDDGGTLKVGS